MNIFKKFFSKNSASEPQLEEENIEAKVTIENNFSEKLSQGLQNSTRKISSFFTKAKLDDDTLQDLEDILLSCDFGIDATESIIEEIKKNRYEKNLQPEDVLTILRDKIAEILQDSAKIFTPDYSHKPYIIMFVGVNGSGKTTTIGKLAAKFAAENKKIMLVAGDTFRAAASEQLNIWGERIGAEVFSSKTGSDPASVIFEAYKKACQENIDILLLDTAGRLQNKTQLMDELAKIIRVLQKNDPSAPHAVLQTLDANIGQNTIRQVEIFKDTANVSGLVMTKLDGSAKGGILVAIAQKFALPIYYIGVGESIEDLSHFSPIEYSNSICGIKKEA